MRQFCAEETFLRSAASVRTGRDAAPLAVLAAHLKSGDEPDDEAKRLSQLRAGGLAAWLEASAAGGAP